VGRIFAGGGNLDCMTLEVLLKTTWVPLWCGTVGH
jgi:hypothetical protein